MYEDTKVKVIYDRKEVDAIVLACEERVGLTIVTPNKKEYVICVNLISSPIYKEQVQEHKWSTSKQKKILNLLNKLFNRMVEEIKTGVIDLRRYSTLEFITSDLRGCIGPSGGGTNGESCAFGQ